MNIPFTVAGSLLLVACAVHTIMGDREYKRLRPDDEKDDRLTNWLLGRCVYHMASINLLLEGITSILIGFGVIPYSWQLAFFLIALHIGYFVAWLATLLASGARRVEYGKQAQWALFLIVLILFGWGIALYPLPWY